MIIILHTYPLYFFIVINVEKTYLMFSSPINLNFGQIECCQKCHLSAFQGQNGMLLQKCGLNIPIHQTKDNWCCLLSGLTCIHRGGFKGGAGGTLPLYFLQSLVFYNHFEELQTMLFEVELIVNNAPLTYVYPNTFESCLTPNYLVFGRQLL